MTIETVKINVKRLNLNGVKYLLSLDNIVYDTTTHKKIGIWNNGKVILITDEDEEEDDDDDEEEEEHIVSISAEEQIKNDATANMYAEEDEDEDECCGKHCDETKNLKLGLGYKRFKNYLEQQLWCDYCYISNTTNKCNTCWEIYSYTELIAYDNHSKYICQKCAKYEYR